MNKKVVVIGSGFGGLSVAAFLARDGYEVKVVEKNEQSGGRASVYKENGFIFDMGPSWYLMPDVFENFFEQFGKRSEDYYNLKRLDPAYRIFYERNDFVDLSADLEKNKQNFEKLEAGAGEKLTKYLAQSEYQYNVSMRDFLYRDYDSVWQFFNRRMLVEGSKLHVFESLDKYTKRYFKSEKLRKILEYSMVFLGGAPKNTPAIYSLMSHIDFNLGVWYPDGGIGKVVEAMENLCKALGVEFVFNSPVTKIITEKGEAVGVEVKGEKINADLVVANADYHFVETELLKAEDQTYKESYWQKRTIAPSAYVLFLGVNKKLSGLTHHNLFFDNDWMRHFDAIFEKPEWPEFPSYYVSCPSKTDSSVAPENCENLFVLVPVASGLEDTEEVRKDYAQKIITDLEEKFGESITQNLTVKKIFSQRDFASRYNAYKGTALGLSHTLRQTAIFRPRHQSKKVANLFYTGQYTHPGIGMPMCLISSQIVASDIKKKYG
jgi:phytoene desaturase